MVKRAFALVMLAVLAGTVVYLWKYRPPVPESMGAAAHGVADDARGLASQAREKLGEVGEELGEARITASVKTALELNRTLRPYSIDVSTERGVVTLQGHVDGEETRARAEAVALAVPDVVRVVNHLLASSGPGRAAAPPVAGRTLGESLDDRTLEVRVKLALSLNRELRGSDLVVQAYRREVTVFGEAVSLAQREAALRTIRETDSVQGVVDRIQVGPVAERAAAAQRALRSNPNLKAFDLEVHEEAGRLVLHGRVRTPAEKELAELLAREGAAAPVVNAVEVSGLS